MLELHVNRWQHALGVPRHWTATRSEQAARDVEAHTEEIAGELARVIEPWLDEHAVIVLPRVAIDARFDPHNDWHASCRAWGEQLARQLAGALRDPACGAVRFASRAQFAARYVAALARGSAGRWWFTSFAGLRALPAAAAIRTVLTRDAAPGIAILAELDDGESKDVARALGADEAMRVLAEWCVASPGASHGDIAKALTAVRGHAHDQAPVPYVALRALALLGAPASSHDAAVVLVAAALARAARSGAALGELRAIAQGDDALLARWCESGLARARQSVTVALDGKARGALRSFAANLAVKAPAPTREAPAEYDTSCGGAAWLWYALNDFLADTVPRLPWPQVEGTSPAAAISLTVACIAWPPARSLALFHDEAWRTLLGIEPSFSERCLHDFLSEADAAADAWAGAWPSLLARWSRSTLLARRGHRVDRETGLWLTADVAGELPEAPSPDFATRLARARAAQRESQFLDRSELAGRLPAQWQCLLRAAAQAALRRLAFRIPGMAWASAAYLHANVLDVRARVHAPAEAGEAWRVQIARPPLDVLLSMTGLARAKFDVLPGRAVALGRLEG